jgi:hypothetical protein
MNPINRKKVPMSTLREKIEVVLTAAPTYLVGAGVIVSAVSDEVSDVLPNGWQDNAVAIGGTLLGIIAAATAIVRRVTPVFKNQRGLVLPEGQSVVTVTLDANGNPVR